MHYVMSDIHGQYNRFLKMLEEINFSSNDTLYILGDVIDRGPDGGFLLLEVLTHPNIEFILGNHELMMIASQISDIEFLRWMQNGADPTISQLLELGINGDELVENLRKCKLAIPELIVNNRKFYLVHAYPIETDKKQGIYITDIHNREDLEEMVWSRNFAKEVVKDEIFDVYPDTTFIIGHTPLPHCKYCTYDKDNLPLISSTGNGRVINIDCGCAGNIRLGCLRLEDMQTYYA